MDEASDLIEFTDFQLEELECEVSARMLDWLVSELDTQNGTPPTRQAAGVPSWLELS